MQLHLISPLRQVLLLGVGETFDAKNRLGRQCFSDLRGRIAEMSVPRMSTNVQGNTDYFSSLRCSYGIGRYAQHRRTNTETKGSSLS